MQRSPAAVRRPAPTRSLTRIVALAAALACALPAPAARAQARVDNPFAGATWYLSPDYAKRIAGSAAQISDAALKAKVAKLASIPTAFWLDRTAAIKGTGGAMGLAAHLDAALAQQQAGKPIVVIAVVYNLPGRDCSALSSNGELGPTEIGRYKTEYIDPIAAIERDPKYASLRIVNVIEVDSLPNLITNLNYAVPDAKTGQMVMRCAEMQSNGNYRTGIAYALSTLRADNIYNYLDAAHHGWLGWDSNFEPAANLFVEVAKQAGGFDFVQGFITNSSNYSALVEPYIQINATTRGSSWLDWNYYADERSYAIALRNMLVSKGFKSSLGMLIDTARNGWGGPKRPTKASTSTDANTMVNESRVDRRIHAGNWCNQSGAGLGERPQAVGTDGIHAYVWVKPPGESDGNSSKIENTEGKGFDRMCDPTYGGNQLNKNNLTGALANAPLSGQWFHEQLVELVQNAYPPLDGGGSDPVPNPTGDFSLTASPKILTINQGESGSTTILIGKTGGFSGAVALSATGLPSGATASFLPASPADGQSTLTLTTTSSTPTGAFPLTLTGSSGTVSRTTTLTLSVNAAGAPSFALSAAPTTLSIARGARGSATISVAQSGGFSSAVALTAEGLPTGVTASFDNQAPTASTKVTFEASSSAAVGAALVTVVGTSGNVTKATTIALTVTDPGGTTSSSGATSSSGSNTSSSGGTSGSSSGSNGSSSGAGTSGGTNSKGTNGSQHSSGGCTTLGGPDVTLTLLAFGGALVLRVRRRRA